jgi:phosphomevalonate kinase
MASLSEAAAMAAETVDAQDGASLVVAARRTGAALDRLGLASGTHIVSQVVRRLARAAESEGAAFLPSGAGGGDVAIFVGMAAPSEAFLVSCRALGMMQVPLGVDPLGVRAIDIV